MRAFVLVCAEKPGRKVSHLHRIQGGMSHGGTCVSVPPRLVICVGHVYGGDAQVVDEGGVIAPCSRQVAHPVQGRQKTRSLRKASRDNKEERSNTLNAAWRVQNRFGLTDNRVKTLSRMKRGYSNEEFYTLIKAVWIKHPEFQPAPRVQNHKKSNKSVFIMLLKSLSTL